MLQECFHRLRSDLLGWGSRPAELLDEMLRQKGNVLGTLVERGQIDLDDVEAVVQVFAELPFLG